jgi:hypothetical protein
MDFVQKKLVKSQVNKLKTTLGLDGDSHHGSNQFGNVFGDSEGAHPAPDEESTFAVDEAVLFYESCPNNYPWMMKLFFVDRSILSLHARPTVDKAHLLFLFAIGAAVANLLVHVFLVVVRRGRAWVDLLVSGFALLGIFLFELVSYETAFRGAYRASQSTLLLYMLSCCANIVLFGIYSFLGIAIFHGWTRLANTAGKQSLIYKILTGVEASIWTFLLCFSGFILFEVYKLRNTRASGLSAAARASAKSGQGTRASTAFGNEQSAAARDAKRGVPSQVHSATVGPHRSDADRERLEEIKSRYRTGG